MGNSIPKPDLTSDINVLLYHLKKGNFKKFHPRVKPEILEARRNDGRNIALALAESEYMPMYFEKFFNVLQHHHVDLSVLNYAGQTVAILCAQKDNLKMLALLPFDQKFKADKSGCTPLMMAVTAGSWNCFKHLLHLLRQKKHIGQAKKLLEMKDRDGRTALALAKSDGNVEMVQLIEWELRAVSGSTRGSSHTGTEQEELVKLLSANNVEGLKKLLTPINCDFPNTEGKTLLMMAILQPSPSPEMLNLLIKHCDPTAALPNGQTCLHLAAKSGIKSAVAILIQNGAVVNCVDDDGKTPLMLATESNRVGVVEILINHVADLDLKDKKGNNALMLAHGFKKTIDFELNRIAYVTKIIKLILSNTQELKKHVLEGTAAYYLLKYKIDRGSPLLAGPPPQTKTNSGDQYNVTHPQGLCLIINQNQYETSTGCKPRQGSEKDVQEIKAVFERLQFRVQEKNNLTKSELQTLLIDLANDESIDILTEDGCFVCFLMAHGCSGKITAVDGEDVAINDIIKLFQADKCKKLAGKPKLFFIQACRRLSVGGPSTDASGPLADENSTRPCAPERDFAVFYATTDGCFANRHPESGSPFIQYTCALISEHHREEHIVDIMTKVNEKFSKDPSYISQQVPVIESRLRSKYYLDPDKAGAS